MLHTKINLNRLTSHQLQRLQTVATKEINTCYCPDKTQRLKQERSLIDMAIIRKHFRTAK